MATNQYGASRPENQVSRRSLFAAAPVLLAGLAIPAGLGALGAPIANDTTADMLAVIAGLEADCPWEASSTAAAKHFAARQMRKAMGLDLPDPELAQLHVDYQRQALTRYQNSIWGERAEAKGLHHTLLAFEQAV